jgi:hypothetical protein
MGGDGGGAAGSGDGTRALDQTPTWAVAAVCAVIVAASILLEGLLHHLGQVRRPEPSPSSPVTFSIFQLRLFSFLESFWPDSVLSFLINTTPLLRVLWSR